MYFLSFTCACHQVFTFSQRTRLREIFEKDPYPTQAFRNELAAEMGVTQCQITNWFMNNRRLKKLMEESVHNDTPSLQEETGKIDYIYNYIPVSVINQFLN